MAGLTVAVVCFGAATWPVAGAARADQISLTRTQLQALQVQAAAGAAHIRQLTLAYDQASTQAASLTQQVAAGHAQLARFQSQLDTTRQALREDAINGYTGNASNAPSGSRRLGGTEDPAVRAEYLQIAAGDVSEVVDQYRAQVANIAAASAALDSELRASQAAVRAADAARQAALGEAETVQAQLDAVQSQLSELLAARAEADAKAAQTAIQQTRTSPPSQGAPVNNGLVSTVQTLVSPAPPPPPADNGGAGGVWLQLRQCESGDNYQANTGNGFYGAYQFSPDTWNNLGFPGRPDQEPPGMQDEAAQKLQAEAGWGQWPACAAALGLT
ncbi:MAG: transglycosylase family protein [Acidimicrobiales bacterium]|nr:transglycosylase family protein [Acidimicrobiales bacterium]